MKKIEGIHHACITVSDYERSRDWYVEVLGASVLTEFTVDAPELGRAVRMPGAKLRGCMLKWGRGETVIEMLCYKRPVGEAYDPATPMCNIGCTHVAFTTVHSIDSIYQDLLGKGVQFYAPPQVLKLSEHIVKMCYFKDPDGITLELVGT